MRVQYAKEPEELLHNHTLGSGLRGTVSKTQSTAVTWTDLEDYLREQQTRINDLLWQVLRTERPHSNERVLIYYWRVGLVLDRPEGRSTVGDYVTLDQLEMLLSLFPTEETNLWGMGQLNVNQGSIPTAFREFCRATDPNPGKEQRTCAGAGAVTRWGNLGGIMCVWGSLWGELHAGGMQHVQGDDSQGSASGHPKKAVVSLLLPALGQPALPFPLAAGLPHPRMHAHSPQAVTRCTAERGGQGHSGRGGAGA